MKRVKSQKTSHVYLKRFLGLRLRLHLHPHLLCCVVQSSKLRFGLAFEKLKPNGDRAKQNRLRIARSKQLQLETKPATSSALAQYGAHCHCFFLPKIVIVKEKQNKICNGISNIYMSWFFTMIYELQII